MKIKLARTKEQMELIESFRGPNSDMAVETFCDLLEPVLEGIAETMAKQKFEELIQKSQENGGSVVFES